METYLTTKQVQDLFRVDRITIYRMLQDGRLKGVKIGNQWRFLQKEVERVLEGGQVVEEAEGETIFPIHCVQTIQDLFSSISLCSALVVDQEGNTVTETSRPCFFCELIQSSENGLAACRASWKAALTQAKDNNRVFTCHAGLNYMGAAVISQNKLVGMFLAGQFYAQPSEPIEQSERIRRLAKMFGLNEKELMDAVKDVPLFSGEQLSHLLQQPTAAARAIESILTQRTAFVQRLQQIANLTQNL